MTQDEFIKSLQKKQPQKKRPVGMRLPVDLLKQVEKIAEEANLSTAKVTAELLRMALHIWNKEEKKK